MRRAIRAACVIWALSVTSVSAQDVTFLQKFKDWSAYAATGTPKVCFAVAKPKDSNPKKGIKRDPIFFYISRWPADNVVNEVSVKMGYPFGSGAKATVTICVQAALTGKGTVHGARRSASPDTAGGSRNRSLKSTARSTASRWLRSKAR